jgi:alpha-D-xyloside xylohydrolase
MSVKKCTLLILAACLLAVCGTTALDNTALSAPGDGGGSPVILDIGAGKLLVEPHADGIIRVRFAPDGIFREKTINTFLDPGRTWNYTGYTVEDDGETITIMTPKLKVLVVKSSGQVGFYDHSGRLIAAEKGRSSAAVNVDGTANWFTVSQSFMCGGNEALYGFGNINDTMGIRGEEIIVRQGNVEKRTPMFYSNMGYGILFDLTSNGRLTWPDGSTYSYTGEAADSMDYYFFYGPDADAVIAGYRTVTGRASMLPKNALGYTHSRNRYGSQQALLDSAMRFRNDNIPLDTIVIDWRWWHGVDDLSMFSNFMRWSQHWPDPEGMMETLHEHNISASISIWSIFGTNPESETFQYIEENKPDFFIRKSSGFMGGYTYDASSASNRKFYWNIINDHIFSKGLDSMWIDANEPEGSGWANGNETIEFGSTMPIAAIYPLLTNQGVYEGQREVPDNRKRVNTLSRSAVAGAQRYGMQAWSGDIQSTWASYRQEVSGVINYSASGLTYFSTDTGGYFPLNIDTDSNKELFLRWLQFSGFGSVMRTHGEGTDRVPWNFGEEYEMYITDTIRLRLRMMPYIYSLAGWTTQDHYTIVRPLAFDFREDFEVTHIKDQYMFGPAFMVAPVTEEGARQRDVYLPEGRWVDFWTGLTTVSTGEWFTVNAPLTQIPLFMRAGAIVPMGPHQVHANQYNDPTELRVYMGADGQFKFYEDEGDNYNYENGAFSEIPITWDEEAKTLTIGARTGYFDGMLQNRTFEVVFVQNRYGIGLDLSPEYQVSVPYDGSEITVVYDPTWIAPRAELLAPDIQIPVPDPLPQPKMPDQAMVGEWLRTVAGEGRLIEDTSVYSNHGDFRQHRDSEFLPSGGRNGGPAASFSGGDPDDPGGYIEVEDSPTLRMTDGITASVWLHWQPSGNWSYIMNKGGNSASDNPGYTFIIEGGSPQVELQSTPGEGGGNEKVTLKAGATIPPAEWAHLAFSWQSEQTGGDGFLRIFMNGELVAMQQTPAGFLIGQDDKVLRLGAADDKEIKDWPHYYRGMMTGVQLFNYGMSEQEIRALFDGTAAVLPNVTGAKAIPDDGQIELTWEDPEGIGLKHIRVEIEALDGSDRQEFEVVPGVQSQTISGLENDTFYNITFTCVMEDGSESSSLTLVGFAGLQPGLIDCVYTSDTAVFGWLVNRSHEPMTGTVVIETLNADGSVADRGEIAAFTVPVYSMRQFTLPIGTYAEGQQIRVSFEDYALPVTAERTFYEGDPEEIMKAGLLAAMERKVDRTHYSAASFNQYLTAMYAARMVYNTRGVSQAEIDSALAALNAAADGLTEGDGNGGSNGGGDSGEDEGWLKKNLPALLIGLGAAVVGGVAAFFLIRKKKK